MVPLPIVTESSPIVIVVEFPSALNFTGSETHLVLVAKEHNKSKSLPTL